MELHSSSKIKMSKTTNLPLITLPMLTRSAAAKALREAHGRASLSSTELPGARQWGGGVLVGLWPRQPSATIGKLSNQVTLC